MVTAAKGFKALEINRDDELKTILERRAKYKTDLLKEGHEEASRWCIVDDLKAFSDDFVAYTIKHILENNDALKGLRISQHKLLDLLEVDLSRLESLQNQYEQNIAQVFWDDEGLPYTKVNKTDYVFYTKNQKENRNLETIHNFIDALDNLEDLVSIQKARFMQMTQGLLYVDVATAELKINHRLFIAL